MTVGATLVASFLVVLARPSTWPLGLAGFLLRGGFVVVLVPIVVLPTPVGLANVLAPILEDIAFGRRADELAAVLSVAVALLLAWLIGGGLLAAATETELVRRVAADDEIAAPAHDRFRLDAPGRAWRVVVARSIAHVPFVIALGWGVIRIVAVAYRELTVPSDVTVPIVARVIAGAPDAVAAVVLTWLIGETIGAYAARLLVLRGLGLRAALRGGLARFVRNPVRGPWLAAVSTVALLALLLASGVAAGTAWDQVRAALATTAEPLLPIVLVVAFVGLFLSGLTLVSVVSAWRNAIWTLEVAGTFGAMPDRREGD